MGSLAYQPPLGELRQQGRWRGNSQPHASVGGLNGQGGTSIPGTSEWRHNDNILSIRAPQAS
jgi:hypothetical protein